MYQWFKDDSSDMAPMQSAFNTTNSMQSFQILSKRRMVNMLVLNAVDRWFEPRWGMPRYYAINIRWFSAKHATLF